MIYLNGRVDFRVEPSRDSLEFSFCERFLGLTTADHIPRPVASLKFMAARRREKNMNVGNESL